MEPSGAGRPDEMTEALDAALPAILRLVLARRERRREADTPEGRLSPEQQLTLLVLVDGPLSVSEVAQGTGVAVSTATRMLQGLTRMGFVATEAAPEDRRRRNSRITDEGRRVLAASVALRNARFAELLAPLTDEDRAALLRGVRVLAAAIALVEARETSPQRLAAAPE